MADPNLYTDVNNPKDTRAPKNDGTSAEEQFNRKYEEEVTQTTHPTPSLPKPHPSLTPSLLEPKLQRRRLERMDQTQTRPRQRKRPRRQRWQHQIPNGRPRTPVRGHQWSGRTKGEFDGFGGGG